VLGGKKAGVATIACPPWSAGRIWTEFKGYAEGVLELQAKRLSADYDPSMRYRRADALAAVSEAQSALTRFKNTTDAEREAFLALLVFKPR
jgi:hypothetical protein